MELSGDLDLYSAQGFFKAAESTILGSAYGVLIDIFGVGYLDYSGGGAIIRLLQLARARGLRLSFSGIHGTPRKVLSMCNLLPLLKETENRSTS